MTFDFCLCEAISLMRKMIPSHIVYCFLQTGYDTLDVLADINIESLAVIKEIVNHDHPNETCFRHQHVPMSVVSPSSHQDTIKGY